MFEKFVIGLLQMAFGAIMYKQVTLCTGEGSILVSKENKPLVTIKMVTLHRYLRCVLWSQRN